MEIREGDLINQRERFAARPIKIKQPVDTEVSKVVGKTVLANDPRLIRLVASWRKRRPADDTVPDDYLSNPKNVAELKKVFNA